MSVLSSLPRLRGCSTASLRHVLNRDSSRNREIFTTSCLVRTVPARANSPNNSPCRGFSVTAIGKYNGRYGRSLSTSIPTPSFPLQQLLDRGLIQDHTQLPDEKILDRGGVSVYVGFDPTADSLHIGHLPLLLILCHLSRAGLRPIALVGGGTARIGDPSGKDAERPELMLDIIEKNTDSLKSFLHDFWNRAEIKMREEDSTQQASYSLTIVNNKDWYDGQNVLDFMSKVGRHMSVRGMLERESVQKRLSDRDEGISFLEFSYMAFQAYDFSHLYDHYDCRLQLGGSDQWGNVVMGCQYIRRSRAYEKLQRGSTVRSLKSEAGSSTLPEAPEEAAGGLTTPLLTTADGKKIGKSAGNAVWLSPSKSSDFELYQWLLRVQDADVRKFFCLFTLLDMTTIDRVVEDHQKNAETRSGQKRLAQEVLELLRGKEALRRAEFVTDVCFNTTDMSTITGEKLLWALDSFPVQRISKHDLLSAIPSIVHMLVRSKLCKSNNEARRTVLAGGCYLNKNRVSDVKYKVCEGDLIDERFLLLQLGTKKTVVVEAV